MIISIIIPVLNDADALRQQLPTLQEYRQTGHEVIVVDGGSADASEAVARDQCDVCVQTGPGRARQMNRGAELAGGDVLLFLHADTRLPDQAAALIGEALETSSSVWGRFDIRLSGCSRVFRVIETFINLRSHWSGIATGDQGFFVRARAFQEVNGYPVIPLMEDVALSKKLRRLAWPVRIRRKAITSSRRWEQQGVISTILLMWRLRLLYFFGASPEYLVKKYYG